MKRIIFVIVLVQLISGCTSMYTQQPGVSLAQLTPDQKDCYDLADTNAKWGAAGAGLSFLAGGAAAAGATSGLSLVCGAISATVVYYSTDRNKTYVDRCTIPK